MLRAPFAASLAGILALHLCGAEGARAEEPAAVEPPPAGCADAEARLAFVHERLDADAHAARRWMWEWTIAYGGLALGQAGIALFRDDPGERAELYVGAAKSLLGLVPVLGLQVPALRDSGRLHARVDAPGAESERCAAVAEAERMLAASAADEAFNRGFLAHAGNVLVNGGGLLIIGLGYDRWVTGAIGTVVGISIGELQIFTRPTASLRGASEYRARWMVTPTVSSESAGLQVVGTF
jgi:hypothetical protein